jgi:hypothetical protein
MLELETALYVIILLVLICIVILFYQYAGQLGVDYNNNSINSQNVKAMKTMNNGNNNSNDNSSNDSSENNGGSTNAPQSEDLTDAGLVDRDMQGEDADTTAPTTVYGRDDNNDNNTEKGNHEKEGVRQDISAKNMNSAITTSTERINPYGFGYL